jgi:hypothetical protein
MMLNDTLGDCVIAAKGHLIILFTTLTGLHRTIVLPDNTILAGYEAVGGYVPDDPSTDNGCSMLAGAQYYRSVGFGGHRISAYAAVHPNDEATVQVAVNLFGACDMGFRVPQSAMDQFDAGEPWTVVPGSPIVGGHDVPIVAYDRTEDMYWCVSWARIQPMSGAFFRKYCDEAYAYLSPDWVFAGSAPNHYRLATLAADLGQLNATALSTINWPRLWAWIQQLARTLGPVAVPILEGLIAHLPLTAAEIQAINTLLESLLKGSAAA